MALMLVGVGLYFYWESDKNSVIGTWVAEDNKSLVYIFNSDKTFTKFKSWNIETGTYKYVENKTLKITFDSVTASSVDSLSLLADEDSTFLFPDGDLRDDYFGGVFEFTNKSNMPIKIINLIPANYTPSANIKIYMSNGPYYKFSLPSLEEEWWYQTKDTSTMTLYMIRK